MDSEERPTKIRKIENSSAPEENDDRNSFENDLVATASVAISPYIPTRQLSSPGANDATTSEIELLPKFQDGNDEHHAIEKPMNPNISKNQLRKLRKQERWDSQRESRRILRKEKNKARKQRRREERINAEEFDCGVTQGGSKADTEANSARGSPGIKSRHPQAVQLPVTFVYDCSWDDKMSEREIVSLGGQLTRCYSDNHKAKYRSHLVISSFEKRLKDRFDTVLSSNYKNWKGVRFRETNFVQVAQEANQWMVSDQSGGLLAGQFQGLDEATSRQQGEVIYLSSDSDETLTELKPYSTYVIGGLVDKNRYKGICHRRASEEGIRTAKLPIGDYVEMASRKVLTINHVSEIMLKWLDCGDWAIAFEAVIPKRKGGVLKSVTEGDEKGVEDEVPETVDKQLDIAEAIKP